MLLKHNGEAMKAKHIKCLAVLFSAVTVLLVACRKDSFDYGVFIGDDINQQKILVELKFHNLEVVRRHHLF